MKSPTLIVIALATTSLVAAAQVPPSPLWPPLPGARARVLSPVFGADMAVGVVESVKGDTLLFRRHESVSSVGLKTSEITRMEVPTGTHTEIAKWSVIGFLVGGLAGAGVGAGAYTPPPPCPDPLSCIVQGVFTNNSGRTGAAIGGGIIGSLAGVLLGAWWGQRPRDNWTAMRLPPS